MIAGVEWWAANMEICTIVVPCYNEEIRLDTGAFREYLSRSSSVNVIFVDDGSSDRTLDCLRLLQSEFPEKVDLLANTVNAGKAEAVRAGMLRALANPKVTIIGFWDADLATPLHAVEDLLGVFSSHPFVDIVFGSRVKLLGRDIERRAVRHYLGRVFATCASLVLGLPVYDTQCGAKLFRATPELANVLERPFLSRWIFDVELVARFIQVNHGGRDQVRNLIYEFPLNSWKDVPGSKLRAKDFLIAAKELLVIRHEYLSKGAARKLGTPALSKLP